MLSLLYNVATMHLLHICRGVSLLTVNQFNQHRAKLAEDQTTRFPVTVHLNDHDSRVELHVLYIDIVLNYCQNNYPTTFFCTVSWYFHVVGSTSAMY